MIENVEVSVSVPDAFASVSMSCALIFSCGLATAIGIITAYITLE